MSIRVTEVLATSDGRSEAVRLLESNAPPEAYIDALASHCDPAMEELLREEFRQLPASLVETVINAWAMAEAGGKSFELRSAPPDSPLDFARNRRVRFTIDAEEDGVVVYLSHVPGRHAAWYRPAETVA